ncbi:MAG: glycosyltransferase family 9 protein [Thermoanaerobaculum sp.]|nr:glycosyltransferase family 9 protein [Thermoanaerobaculum sp.]
MGRFPCQLLVDLPNWLGDLIHSQPALARLIAANREGHTTLLAPPQHRPLLQGQAVFLCDRPPRAGPLFARSLGRYDLAITFRPSTRAKLLLRALPAGEAWASCGRGAKLLGLHTFFVDRSRHQRHDFDQALVSLGLVPVNGQSSAWWNRAPAMPRGRSVVLLPGSLGLRAKRYPKEHFLHVSQKLQRAGYAVTLVVGQGDAEVGVWLAQRGGGALFPPQADLGQVMELLAGSCLAVGNDSGLTHLAAAVGCPTVALFGPTSPARTGPSSGLVLQAPHFSSRGWAGLPPERVLAAIDLLLGGDLHDHPGTGSISKAVGR